MAALLDDFNTPAAISALSGPLKAANDLLSTKAGRKAPGRLATLATHQLAFGEARSLTPPRAARDLRTLSVAGGLLRRLQGFAC
jgi:cysteinyl-tRNA synthetase